MKRLHVHVSVEDLPAPIRFYSTLFAREPTVTKDDYAITCCHAKSEKAWVDDPRGVRWETLLTTGECPMYGADAGEDAPHRRCCAPRPAA